MADDQQDELIFVQYRGNTVNENNTELISFGDDREPVAVGGKVGMTQKEIDTARSFGLVLVPVPETSDTPVEDLSKADAKAELESYGVEVDGRASEEKLKTDLAVKRSELESPGAGQSPSVSDESTADSTGSAAAAGSTSEGVAGNGGTAASTGAAS